MMEKLSTFLICNFLRKNKNERGLGIMLNPLFFFQKLKQNIPKLIFFNLFNSYICDEIKSLKLNHYQR